MSSSFYDLGDFEKAEELGLEAVDIYTKTLGLDHEETKEARESLGGIQNASERVGGEWGVGRGR
jgi:hypothetical protein